MGYKRFCQVVQMEARTNMADLMKAFRKIDTNGDGFITAQELHKKLSKVCAVTMTRNENRSCNGRKNYPGVLYTYLIAANFVSRSNLLIQ